MRPSGSRLRWLVPLPVLVGLALCAALPAAAEGEDDGDGWEDGETVPVEVHGFVEGAGGARVTDHPATADGFVLGESRFRLDLSHYADPAALSVKGDFVQDAVADETVVDIRQAWLSLRTGRLDIRAGRQVLTWGTGDLLFLNDLFPKDFVSFFVGRDDEFLKAPSNAIKLAAYTDAVNVDLVFTPVFTPDTYITGERLSFFDPGEGRIVAADSTRAPLDAPHPARTLENAEWAVRLHRNAMGYELALYGTWGFTKQPRAAGAADGMPAFSRLAAGGASLRGNAGGGILNVEGAYYVSRDDTGGDDPDVPNSEVRALFGYEREAARNVTLGLQYYLEWIQDHDRLLAAASDPDREPGAVRDLVTVRLTSRLMRETLILSLFGFVAVGDEDTHWRASVTRQWTDAVSVALGTNVMTGPRRTFFGQLGDNSNVFVRLRYAF
jgi:hypothetical protein